MRKKYGTRRVYMDKNIKKTTDTPEDEVVLMEECANDEKAKSEIKIKPNVPKRFKPSVTSLDEAYANGFVSSNKDGKCEKCGLATMYKERTLCYRCYITEKVK